MDTSDETMRGSTAAILCDVNGTLFKLDALSDRMVEVGLPKDKLPVRTFHRLYPTLLSICDRVDVGSILTRSRPNLKPDLTIAHAAQLWFTRTLRDGKALAITNKFATFREVSAFQLKCMLIEQANGTGAKPTQQQLEGAAATVLGAHMKGL